MHWAAQSYESIHWITRSFSVLLKHQYFRWIDKVFEWVMFLTGSVSRSDNAPNCNSVIFTKKINEIVCLVADRELLSYPTVYNVDRNLRGSTYSCIASLYFVCLINCNEALLLCRYYFYYIVSVLGRRTAIYTVD